jgi:hypothetical protein
MTPEAYKENRLVLSKSYSIGIILLLRIWAHNLIQEALKAGNDTRGALLNCHCCECVSDDGDVLSHCYCRKSGWGALSLEEKAA